MKSDPNQLRPAERPQPEPPEAKEGWKGSDLTEDELVDDEHIHNVISKGPKPRPKTSGGPNVPDVR